MIVACSPPAPTLADRFDPRPADHRPVPDGALRFVGGAPWGPAPENTLWAAADDLDSPPPPRPPGCARSWTAGDQLACANTHTLTLVRGEETLAHGSLAGDDTYHGPSVSVGWSADGRSFAWFRMMDGRVQALRAQCQCR